MNDKEKPTGQAGLDIITGTERVIQNQEDRNN
jgi:hypothetical protein